jgi:tryptophan 7-halogenase
VTKTETGAFPASNAKPRYVIKGSGLAAWSAAKMLADALGGSADVGIIGGDEAPVLPSTISHLALDGESILTELSGKTPLELIRSCNGGFTLGTCLDGWPQSAQRVFHAPGEPLPISSGIAAHNIILKAALAQGDSAHFQPLYEQLRFQARCAAGGKFAPPAQDRQSPRSLLRPAMQIDGDLFAAVMRAAALESGVSILPFGGEHETGAHLIIECDVSEIPPADWQDMRADFGYDHCLSVRVSGSHDHPPYAMARPLDHGLLSIVPMQDGMIASYCFDSATCAPSAAKAALLSQLGKAEIRDEQYQPLSIGAVSQPWRGNQVQISSAAAILGPLYNADAMLLSMQLDRLIRLLPQGGHDMAVTAAEYNRLCAIDFQQLSDFVRLPFVCNQIAVPHWAALREMPTPETLRRRIERFASNGRVVKYDGEIFDGQIWTDMMIALGITPRRYDPAADALDMQQMMGRLGKMVQAFDQTIAAMPAHTEYLDQVKA